MNEKEIKHLESINIKNYGSLENRDNFNKGLKEIENSNMGFFKDKEFDENELESYYGLFFPNGNIVIDFREDRVLPEKIKNEVLEKFRECFH